MARKAENEISDFIIRSLESLSKIKTGKKLAFQGLEEYLSIPEDLLEKEEEFDFEGNLTNNISGEMSNDVTDDETGLQTTDNQPVQIKPTITQKQEVQEEEDVIPDEDGELDITTGGGGGGDGPPHPIPPGPIDEIEKGTNKDEQTESKVLIKVGFKVASQVENGNVFHHLIINSESDIQNTELELLVGSDNDRDDSIEILSTNNGNVSNNKLKNVNLNLGRNLIAIRFADNLKHTVKMKAYEIQ
ncbi:hypothetical protein [Flavisericum labens]|uniref:hypothetical protein n=1 Tax=Flavisericum labens TaxID=3377112 RepID=UPI00387B22FF